MRVVILLISLSLNYSAFAITVSGNVTKLRMFKSDYQTYLGGGVGILTFYVDTLSGACGSNEKRIAISTDHPLYETVFSTVLAAKVSGTSITVNHLETCSQRGSTWDFGILDLD